MSSSTPFFAMTSSSVSILPENANSARRISASSAASIGKAASTSAQLVISTLSGFFQRNARDAVLDQIHRSEVKQRCQAHLVSNGLDRGIAGMVIRIAKRQIEHDAKTTDRVEGASAKQWPIRRPSVRNAKFSRQGVAAFPLWHQVEQERRPISQLPVVNIYGGNTT